MRKYFDHRLGKNVITIDIGEKAVSGENVYIGTVLGSCVSVVLYDPDIMIGGMNHFQRAYPLDSNHSGDRAGYYGCYAIPLLLNDMKAHGCERKRLKAKIFGGSCKHSCGENPGIMNVGAGNVSFALDFLEKSGIPILTKDVGGSSGRRIYFDVKKFSVLVKKLDGRSDLFLDRRKVD